ncbi:MAG: hypothetical protein WBQ30_16945, partial [Thermoanaerobaculia bacterium]
GNKGQWFLENQVHALVQPLSTHQITDHGRPVELGAKNGCALILEAASLPDRASASQRRPGPPS